VAYEPKEIVVRVVDDGEAGAERPAPHGMEDVPHGLLGMRERATIYDGRVSAGPRPEGGFAVVLTLPIPSPPLGDPAGRP
jgi:signal transduction histidine kinase